jgi:hypothetical protein
VGKMHKIIKKTENKSVFGMLIHFLWYGKRSFQIISKSSILFIGGKDYAND